MIGAFNTRCGGFVWREKMGWQGLRHSAGDGSFREDVVVGFVLFVLLVTSWTK